MFPVGQMDVERPDTRGRPGLGVRMDSWSRVRTRVAPPTVLLGGRRGFAGTRRGRRLRAW